MSPSFIEHIRDLFTRAESADQSLVPLAAEMREAWTAMGAGMDPEGDGSGIRFDGVLHKIIAQPSQSWVGLIAKARFMTVLEEQRDYEAAADLGWSLARDLLRIGGAQ